MSAQLIDPGPMKLSERFGLPADVFIDQSPGTGGETRQDAALVER